MLTPEDKAAAHTEIADQFRKQDARELGLPGDASYDDIGFAKIRRDIEERCEDARQFLAEYLKLPQDATWESFSKGWSDRHPKWHPRESEKRNPEGVRERMEKEFFFASPEDGERFSMLLDLMGNQAVDAGAGRVQYQDQLYSAVSQKLEEQPTTDALYKSGFIGGRVETAEQSVNYQIFVDRDNKIVCRIS